MVQPYGAKPLTYKQTNSLNTFKHNLKEHYLIELNNFNPC